MQERKDEFQRRRAARQRRIRRRRIRNAFITMLCLALITVIILCFTVFFPVKTITAKGSNLYSSAQIISASGLSEKNNVFTFSTKRVTEKLQKKLPYIDTVKIKRSISGKVDIKVTDAEEYVSFYVKGKYYTVSRNGWVLNSYSERVEGVPLIHCEGVTCKVGSGTAFKKQETAMLLETMLLEIEKHNIEVSEINLLDPLSITLKADGRFNVNLGTNGSIDKKIAHLSGMIESIERERSGYINLSMWSPEKTEGTFVEGEIS